MKKRILMISMALAFVFLTSCGKTWTCDKCHETFKGDAYYDDDRNSTLCADCAWEYWWPLPIDNYKK